MSSLPKFVNVILTNEFVDDPYWYKGIETDLPEAYHAISNIKKSQSDAQSYVEALEIYRKYIGDIIEYYGGQRAIDAYFRENGEYPKGYIAPPKLQMKKKNRDFARTGYIPPKIGKYIAPISSEDLAKIGDEMFAVPEDEMEDIKLYKPKNKSLRKRIRKTVDSFQEDTRSDAYGANANIAARYNVIAQYYERLQVSDGDSSEFNSAKLSIKEMAKLYDAQQRYEQEEWIQSRPAQERVDYHDGRLIPTGSLQKYVDWANFLNDNGFEKAAVKFLKRFNESDKKYLKIHTGIRTKSKKELAKEKKRFEKSQKSMSKGDELRSLANIMSRTSSGVSSDLDDDMLDRIVRRSKE